MAELPTGTVTFLFTDLEGSTRLWDEDPEAMQAALARHDQLLRDAITGNRGHIVKATGDGVHAAFSDAIDAVRAAVEGQRAFDAEAWVRTGPLRVRMGIHTGMAEQRDGDYFGPSLNRAARLMAAAHGGQAVVSLATEEIVRDSLPAEIDLIDLGEHRLRDVARPERVFQIDHAALRRDFPGLQASAHVPGNLPLSVSSFVGREGDVAAVLDLLDDARLVTLIGVGGVGKTRLGLEVAAEFAPRTADGAWFCDLASVVDDETLPVGISAVLGVAPRAGRSPLDGVAEFLRSKEIVLVLDNCEHLVEGAASFAAMVLRQCPGVRVLATSREALGVEGERLFPVRPLPLPDSDVDVIGASQCATVQLFTDRVAGFRPDFRLDLSNVRAVVEICRRLDGIPLALELAAARARSLSPEDIVGRLDRRFALLAGGRRRGVARHETLRAAIDWSYDLLDEPERRVLDRMSVFAGGCTLEAIEAVAGELGSDVEIVDVVTSLVDKSLSVVDPEAVSTRYRLLETIRQYALERLDGAGGTLEARDRHLDYFGGFVEQARDGLASSQEERWADRTRSELDNLRAALAWAVEIGDAERGLALATSLATQSYYRYNWNIGSFAHAVLGIPGVETHLKFPLALASAAEHEHHRGDFDAAARLAEQALALCGADSEAQMVAETVLGGIATFDSRDDACVHYERALVIARRSGNPALVARVQGLLALALPFRGTEHLDRALREAEEALVAARRTGSLSAISGAEFAIGYVLMLRGDPAAEPPLLAARETAVDQSAGGVESVLALHYLAHGTPLQALDAMDRALTAARFQGDRAMAANTLDMAVGVFLRCGDAVTATEIVAALASGAMPRIVRIGVPAERRTRGIAKLESMLSPDELASARERGAAMGLDETVDHALRRMVQLEAKHAGGAPMQE